MSALRLKLGPADHGRPLSLDDYESADYALGHKYEIIDGRLYVSPLPNFPENRLERWLDRKVSRYAEHHPEVLNYVTVKSRVYVHEREQATVPEPDLAAFHNLDPDADFREVRWQDLAPVLVAEVLVDGDEFKDLERNPDLYLDVPSIKEYWVLVGRDDPNKPTLIQHRRYGKRWVRREHPYGTTFTTKTLPGFSLLIDPRK